MKKRAELVYEAARAQFVSLLYRMETDVKRANEQGKLSDAAKEYRLQTINELSDFETLATAAFEELLKEIDRADNYQKGWNDGYRQRAVEYPQPDETTISELLNRSIRAHPRQAESYTEKARQLSILQAQQQQPHLY